MPIDTWYKDYVSPDGDPSTWKAWDVQKYGKALACKYLERFGMNIVGQDCQLWNDTGENFQSVDIVVDDDGAAILFGVRAYIGENSDEPPKLEVMGRQVRDMREAVLRYLGENPHIHQVRFDILAIRIVTNTIYQVRHDVGAVVAEMEEMDVKVS